MMKMMCEWWSGFFYKLSDAMSSVWGWLLIAVTTLCAVFKPEWVSFAVVYTAVFFDLFWGIRAAKKQGKYVLSKAMRETITKIKIYSFALVGVFFVEKIVHEEGSFIGIRVLAVYAAVCELWSMSASMLIVNPGMPFLKIFRKQLKGEIESKLGSSSDELFPDDEPTKKEDKK